MRLWLPPLLASLVVTTSLADVISETIDATELTVYRDTQRGTEPLSLGDEYYKGTGLAMVTETRTIEIPAGASTIQFRGVVDSIVPQTATLEGVAATVVEANFDYNLLSPGTLFAKSLDRPVVLIRTDRATGAVEQRHGTLRSGPDGVVIDFGGEMEALNCSGLHERLVFADVPESLTDTPTLSMTIRAATAGKYQVQLSYLALGMDWSADYTARLHADGQRMEISAWITLLNRNGSRLADAKTHVVAGTLAREEDETLAPEIDLPSHRDRCWPIGDFRLRQRIARHFELGTEGVPFAPPMSAIAEVAITSASFTARATELADYKLYTLPFATTVEPRQMKQARLLDVSDVRFEKLYAYRADSPSNELTPQGTRILLRLTNTKRMGLGMPLPAGTWRVIELTDDGRQYLVGEETLEDTPLDLERDLHLGMSNDVTAISRVIEAQSEISEKQSRVAMEVQIANAGASAADVHVLHSRQLGRSVKIAKESHRHHTKGGDYVWAVRVAPGESTVLRYTLLIPKG